MPAKTMKNLLNIIYRGQPETDQKDDHFPKSWNGNQNIEKNPSADLNEDHYENLDSCKFFFTKPV